MTLGARIAALRKERGLSQEGLGEQVGVSRQAVSKWESGSALPDVNNCVALSRAFGVTLAQLLELEEEQAAPAGELSEEQLAMAQAIAEKYLESLPRPKSWRQRRKWPWVLAASVALVLLSAAGQWIYDLNRTVKNITNDMLNVHHTVSQAVEEQVSSALTEVTRLVEEGQWQLVEVDLKEGQAVFDLTARLRRRTPETPVMFSVSSGGETRAAEGNEMGGGFFSARLTCPLEDEISFFLTFQVDGEERTEALDQVIQLKQSYEMRLFHQVVYTQPYADQKLVDGRLPQGTFVPLEIQIDVDSQDQLTGQEMTVKEAAVGLFVNDRPVQWSRLDLGAVTLPRPGLEESWRRWDWELEYSLSEPKLAAGDTLVLALYAQDSYGRVVTQVLWRASLSNTEGDRGRLVDEVWWEDEPYQPAEVGP